MRRLTFPINPATIAALSDPRWKQCEFLPPHTRAEREDFCENPFITHYSNAKKPWHYGYEHPRLHEWFALLNQTAWAGCRPKQAVKERAIEGSSNAGKSRGTAALVSEHVFGLPRAEEEEAAITGGRDCDAR